MDKQQFFKQLHNLPTGWQKPLCMGILNVTPDSFHDGGSYLEPDAALHQFRQLLSAGADIIDIGGMSSRPGHEPVSAEQECARVLPLLERCAGSAVVSVDTDKPEVAAAALQAGADLLNDCSGDTKSPLFELAAEHGAPLVIMHRKGREGEYSDIAAEVELFFEQAMTNAKKVGVKEWQFVLDPGLGFNKNIEDNLHLVQALPQLCRLGRPLLVGYSHKRFVAALSGEQHGRAKWGNAALAAACVQAGAHIVRVHEPAPFWAVARVVQAINSEQG